MEPVTYPLNCWIKYLVQVFPDPGEDANAVSGPGGSKNLNGPLHQFPVVFKCGFDFSGIAIVELSILQFVLKNIHLNLFRIFILVYNYFLTSGFVKILR